MQNNATKQEELRPWWREAYVWLIIAGPAAVVVAGIGTTILAYQGSDRLLVNEYGRHGAQLNRSSQPAVAARNGAALPSAAPLPSGAK